MAFGIVAPPPPPEPPPQEEVVEIVVPKDVREDLHGLTQCSCVRTARAEGVAIPYGTNAANITPNSEPRVGGLVLFEYDYGFHVSKIEAFVAGGYFVKEGNWTPCERNERIVFFNDPYIRGFWYPSPDDVESVEKQREELGSL